MENISPQEQFFESEIRRVESYLQALVQAQQAYKATLINSTVSANKEEYPTKKNSSNPRIVGTSPSVPSELVDKIIGAMPGGHEFSNADIFAQLAENLGDTYQKHPNADTMMSCLLGRRAKRGIIEKIGRGLFRKKGGLLDSSPIA